MVSSNHQRKVTLPEPESTRRPHPLASELTEQEFRKTPAERRENHAADVSAGGLAHMSRPQRKAGSRLAAYALLILGLAIIVAMIVFGTWNWGLFMLGLVILFCYMMLITAPFWLASTTKVAQDEAAKDAVEEHPERRDRAPERDVPQRDSTPIAGDARRQTELNNP